MYDLANSGYIPWWSLPHCSTPISSPWWRRMRWATFAWMRVWLTLHRLRQLADLRRFRLRSLLY